MLISFFSIFAFSSLKNGQNPYRILGIPKNADSRQIKEAYNKLTKKYHPDISKEKDATKKFIEATDAYELLNDNKRRNIFDQTGSVVETPSEEEVRNQRYQRRNVQISFKTPLIRNERDIEKQLGSRYDALLMIYTSFNCPSCADFALFYEDIAVQYKFMIKFMRHDIFQSERFARQIGIKRIPSCYYIKRNKKGDLIYREMKESVQNRENFIGWLISCWDYYIIKLRSAKQAKKWLEDGIGYTHVLSVIRGDEPTIEFKRAATIFGDFCKFAVLVDDFIAAIPQLNVTDIPEIRVYQRLNNFRLNDITDLKNHIKPKFVKLKRKSLSAECRRFCLVFVGVPTKYQIQKYISLIDEPLTYISPNSSFARSLHLKPLQWIVLEGTKKKYSILNRENLVSEVNKYQRNALNMKKLTEDNQVDFDLVDNLNDITEFISKKVNYIRSIKMKEAIDFNSPLFLSTAFLGAVFYLFCCFC